MISKSTINDQRPTRHQSAILNPRVEDPSAHVFRPTRSVQTENGSRADNQRLLKRAGPWLVCDADVEGVGL